MRIHWKPSRSHSAPAVRGIVGLLLLPVTLLAGAVAFVVSLPMIVVLYFYSRHKLKQFLRAFPGQWNAEVHPSDSRAKHVDTVVVETVEDVEPPNELPEQSG